jgi:hypothetical protein
MNAEHQIRIAHGHDVEPGGTRQALPGRHDGGATIDLDLARWQRLHAGMLAPELLDLVQGRDQSAT